MNLCRYRDEIGTYGAFVIGPDIAFFTGSDLIDGGVTASYFHSGLVPT